MPAVTDHALSTFRSRLDWLLDGRSLYSWINTLGVSRGVAESISHGKVPGPEILRLIQLKERVSLDWLISGLTSPILVDKLHDPRELKHALTEKTDLLSLCVLHDNAGHWALMLSQSGEYSYRNLPVLYKHHRLIHSELTPEMADILLDTLRSAPLSEIPVYVLAVDQKQLLGVRTGHVSPYQISQQIVTASETTQIDILLAKLLDQKPIMPAPATTISTDLMRAVISLVSRTAEEEQITLDADQQARVYTAVYRHAHRTGISAQQLDQSLVLTTLEATA